MSDCCATAPGYDLAIVGSGSAAFAAALRASELGARTVMIEAHTLGGTCVNVGCVPSKALIAAAEQLHRGTHATVPGIGFSRASFDAMASAAARTEMVTNLRERKYSDVLAHLREVTLVRGQAAFGSDGRLRVDGVVVEAKKVLLAVGASPHLPAIDGLVGSPFWTSTEAVRAEAVPESLVVLGAGYIGVELAQAYARLGAAVTVITRRGVLSATDPDVGVELSEALQAEGMTILSHASVERVASEAGRFDIFGSFGQATFAQLLVATGRVPNTTGIGLQHIGVETDEHGAVVVNQHLQTSNPNVFAAGDCAVLPAFVYVAASTGRAAADYALGGGLAAMSIDVVPSVVFTDPQVALVGRTEAEARQAGVHVMTSMVRMGDVPRAIVSGLTRGFVKLVAEVNSRVLIGAQIVGPHAGETILPATFALRARLTIDEVVGTFHPYLTWGESFRLAALGFDKDISQLSCCAA